MGNFHNHFQHNKNTHYFSECFVLSPLEELQTRKLLPIIKAPFSNFRLYQVKSNFDSLSNNTEANNGKINRRKNLKRRRKPITSTSLFSSISIGTKSKKASSNKNKNLESKICP